MVGLFYERHLFPAQDPWVVPYDETFLLIQSRNDDRRIVIRRFADLDRVHDSEETVIWAPTQGDHTHQLWAPELHEIAGRWYVYYAASDGENANHRTYVLEADHPLGPYRELGKVADPAHDVWAIDMTILDHAGGLYAVWSGWETVDAGFPQNLYIAPMSDPATISGERHLISEPEHGWERSVAAINEGPQVLRNPAAGKLFIVYSADASWTTAYKMGVLEWTGGDVLEKKSWTKHPSPLLAGGGHGCFVEWKGTIHAVYHRKTNSEPGWGDRVIAVQPLDWDADGNPVLADDPR
jgi:GH43 family beta-xylosidase